LREIVRTNDMVLVSAIGALLDAAKIHHLVFDQNMSVLEGSLGVLPRRVLVAEAVLAAARRVLVDAGLGHELRPDAKATAGMTITQDAVLGGRLTLRQPKRGHRVGHDAMLLAAAVPAHAGERAVDLGAGIGSAGLALARRVPGVDVVLAEIDEALCELAAENIRLNALQERARVVNLDVTVSGAFDAAGIDPGSIDHVLTNPPFNDPARQNVSPDALRRLAHAAPRAVLALWVNTARRLLRTGGVLTLIWRADDLPAVLATLAGFGDVGVMPVLPRPDADPIRILLRAVAGAPAAAPRMERPLLLNTADGQPAGETEAILRGGEALRFSMDGLARTDGTESASSPD
jgi:tRNA1(Val) A37 N6-methylase TrmN6